MDWPLELPVGLGEIAVRHTAQLDCFYSRTVPVPPDHSKSSRVIGSLRTRLPVAWKTAFEIAAATPTMPISPIPLAPRGLTIESASSTKMTSISLHIRIDGDVILRQIVVYEASEVLVNHALLFQGHADAPDDAPR